MNFTNGELFVAFQAIENILFREMFHIKDLEKTIHTKEMAYLIECLRKDQKILRDVRNKMQIEIETRMHDTKILDT